MSKEFFRNLKLNEIPTKDSSEYKAFFEKELDKIKYGLTINGTHISGFLYWHFNHWKLLRDVLDERDNSIVRKFTLSDLRDNEWVFADFLKQAENLKKGLQVISCRRFGKSNIAASYLGRSATIYEGSENVIVGNNSTDISVITGLCDKGLLGLHDYFRWGRIGDDWKKEVTLGVKDKKGNRNEWSKIFIRNTSDGKETEIIAGTTPKALIFDEIGKAEFMSVFNAAKPAFNSPYGWRAVPILFGTGGSFERGRDAEDMFYEPDAHNMLSVILPEEGNKKTSIFIHGTYSLDIPKTDKKLSEFLNVPLGSELDSINISVTDHVRGKEIILERRANASKSKDPKTLLKEMMYFPLVSTECFLTDSENNFPIEAAKKHLDFLERNPIGVPIKLFRDTDGKVKHSFDTNLKPITEFPVKKETIKDGAIMMYEAPVPNAPLYLYIAGTDPYNQDKSDYSESLGSCYIYKRNYDPIAGTFQKRIVASYVARPSTMKVWHETVEMLLEFYNAVCLTENAGTNFIQYMDSKNKSYFLADTFSLLKEISPTSSTFGRIKGLPPTVPVIRHCMNITFEHCNEEIIVGANPDGSFIKALGITRVTDPMLLKEMINYSKDGNFDRIVAFRHLLAFDSYLDKNYETIDVKVESEKKSLDIVLNSSPFVMADINPFGFGGGNPFK